MEELLIAILQGLFEFGLDVLSNQWFDWPTGSRREPNSLILACCCWFAVGAAFGGLSVWVLKYTWIPLSSIRLANLVVAPLTSAYVAQAVAHRRSARYPHLIPRNHFWKSFWFTLALVAVRFAYATRPH